MGTIICTDITKAWGAGTPREVVALEGVSMTVGHGEGQRCREGVGRNGLHVDHLRIAILSELFRQTFMIALSVHSLILLCCLKPQLIFPKHSRLPFCLPWI